MNTGITAGNMILDLQFDQSVLFSVFERIDSLTFNFVTVKRNLLLDRLYKRYIKKEDNELLLSAIDDLFQAERKNCWFKKNYDVKHFLEYVQKIVSYYKDFNPIHIILLDMPYSFVQEQVPFEDYDNLEGDPLWLRPEYMLKKYG